MQTPTTYFAFSCIVVILILFSACDSSESEFIGTTHEVSCSGALTEMGNEQFDFRPHNNCGSGVVFYTTNVTSESGKVTARFRVGCAQGFCIGGVEVLEWN